ncbi:hypothetical protein P7K49_002977 [Saguinus oedipus]|uniref:Uncharacterized protein n=1 Tax=Saguinus oedipus TaxID=9490 RepID=A0ABQ9WIW1_SAGOE|nr:hypothetical protein P7K49_002977 [Saguinus oedipus]
MAPPSQMILERSVGVICPSPLPLYRKPAWIVEPGSSGRTESTDIAVKVHSVSRYRLAKAQGYPQEESSSPPCFYRLQHTVFKEAVGLWAILTQHNDDLELLVAQIDLWDWKTGAGGFGDSFWLDDLAGQAVLAFQRYQIGADSALFSQDYMDPSQDSSMPYAPYVEPNTGPDPAGMGGTYQQPANAFDTEPQGYQSQGY